MNILETDLGHLAALDFDQIISDIARALKKHELFSLSTDKRCLLINAHQVAASVRNTMSPLGSGDAEYASIHFSDTFRPKFDKRIKDFGDYIQKKLQTVLGSEGNVNAFTTPLENWKLPLSANRSGKLGFQYGFRKQTNVQKQRISLRKKDALKPEEPVIRFHKIQIKTGNIGNFEKLVIDSLRRYIQTDLPPSSSEELNDLLEEFEEKPGSLSQLDALRRLVSKETIGKLKREGQICYLQYLRDFLADVKDIELIDDLVRRLRLIEAYLVDSEREDARYSINYGNQSFDIRDIFSQANVFESRLPIIPRMDGSLGHSFDPTSFESQHVFGIQMKLNGPVNAYQVDSSFDYQLQFLDPARHKGFLDRSTYGAINQRRRALETLILFVMVFHNFGNAEHDPIAWFETEILPILQLSDDSQKKAVFSESLKWLKTEMPPKLGRLREVLRNGLKRKHHGGQKEFPVRLAIKKGLLETNPDKILDQGQFFPNFISDGRESKVRSALRYVAVIPDEVETDCFVSIDATITISDFQAYAVNNPEPFDIEYLIEGIEALPVLIAPNDTDLDFTEYKLIHVSYDAGQARKILQAENYDSFVYSFSFLLILYMALEAVLKDLPSETFMPILRLGNSGQDDTLSEDDYFYSVSKILEHMLGESFRTSSQNFNVKGMATKDHKGQWKYKNGAEYKIDNGLTSLYSALPKKFTFASTYIDVGKVAIIVVTSYVSDTAQGNPRRRETTLGEVISIAPLASGQCRIESLRTFTSNIDSARKFEELPVLTDQMSNLYEAGYRHFLYIAQAPYSSTLNLTGGEKDDDLYFMSRRIIQKLKELHSDAKIYPCFYDKYYMVKLVEVVNALYIHDTVALQSVERPQSLVFFNLFNGIQVDPLKHFYSGVVSYSTLLNTYTGILDDQDILKGLILDGEPGTLKGTLLNYLALFHFYRYEATKTSKRAITFKLDPYESIVGTDSVVKLSIFEGMRKNTKFNMLAFLAEVRAVLKASTPRKKETR
jgi:hypothetical protein